MHLDIEIIDKVVTIVAAVLASSGFWAFMQRYFDKNDSYKKLLIGIGHDRIMYLGMQYIKRGYITPDEYENLNDYLYEPYVANGGNGSAKKIMIEINKLPVKDLPIPKA